MGDYGSRELWRKLEESVVTVQIHSLGATSPPRAGVPNRDTRVRESVVLIEVIETVMHECPCMLLETAIFPRIATETSTKHASSSDTNA